MTAAPLLRKFLLQARRNDLRTSGYPKEWGNLGMRVSFGMGSPARVPWVAFTIPELAVSNGYYPVYLYYKAMETLVLAYGVSDTNEFIDPWNSKITSSHDTIANHFDKKVPRYSKSYVFRTYLVDEKALLRRADTKEKVNDSELTADLDLILSEYQNITSHQVSNPTSSLSQGAFYLEKQLEDFIVANWSSTELGKELDLIVENGELLSQQYRTDIGQIDILAVDKATRSHVVIELKKGQTSDDTIGQIARYMGWIEENKKDEGVRGIIIAKGYDKKLQYALKRVDDVDVYIYEIDFKLRELNKQ